MPIQSTTAQQPRSTRHNQLATSLRRTLTTHLMRDFGVHLSPALIRRILDEATEVAETTGFPQLFLPGLAEEKARRVSASLSPEPAVAANLIQAA